MDCEEFDAVVTEPPCAPSRSCISSLYRPHLKELEIDNNDVERFAEFCRKVLRAGSHAAILKDSYMISEGISAFGKSGFTVVPYPYAIQ